MDRKTRARLYTIIFEADTPAGRAFDVLLIVFIGLSVLFSMLDSVDSLNQQLGGFFLVAEWFFTVVFTLEYLVRILVVRRPLAYVFSFYGILDLLAILPSYLGLVISGLPSLIFLRVLRVLRVFRIFKLWKYSREAQGISQALWRALPRIGVFLFAMITIMVLLGSLMYLVEGPENGFTNVFVSIYWAVVTITTVGYGDISPQTPLGQTLASLSMIIGYAIIAVPTGILSAEMVRSNKGDGPRSGGDNSGPGTQVPGRDGYQATAVERANSPGEQSCPACGQGEPDPLARFCRRCGSVLKG